MMSGGWSQRYAGAVVAALLLLAGCASSSIVDRQTATTEAPKPTVTAELDPAAARRLSPGDKQRLIRAFEVARATGIPISQWQQQRISQPGLRISTILLAPPRKRLYAACDARFARMIEAGAVDEAARIAARGLDPDLPAMKALGLPELLSHLRGAMPLDSAINAAQRATRRYAKRQMTWFRHQTTPGLTLTAQFSESLLRCSRHFIEGFLLTGPA